jgi:hypothetical protein
VRTEEERGIKFFNEGEGLDEARLPDWMQTEEIRQAMGALKEFSEKKRSYHAYQARQNYLRQQRSIGRRIQALTTEAAQARADKERARAAEERERAEKERAQIEKGGGPRRGRMAQALVEGRPQYLTPSPFMSAIPCLWHPTAASGRRQSKSAQMRSMIEAGNETARPG